jgi:hypothetical protein
MRHSAGSRSSAMLHSAEFTYKFYTKKRPALCSIVQDHGPALCCIARDHGPALCDIARDQYIFVNSSANSKQNAKIF